MESFAFLALVITIIIVTVTASRFMTRKRNRRVMLSAFGKPPGDRSTVWESISSYHFFRQKHEVNPHHIDDLTWDDLDMDSVFERINTCITSVGEEYLYSLLHEPGFDTAWMEERERLIRFFDENPAVRKQVQLVLFDMGRQNYNGLASLIHSTKQVTLTRPYIYKLLMYLPLLGLLLLPFNLTAGIIVIVGSFVTNTVVHYRVKMKIEDRLPAVRYFNALLSCCERLYGLKNEELNVHLSGLFDCHRQLAKLKGGAVGGVRAGMTDIEMFTEYMRILILSDIRSYIRVTDGIKERLPQAHALSRAFGELEAAICILSYRKSLQLYTIPEFTTDSGINCEQLCHPLLSNPVDNSASLPKHIIVTGSNASGKSTFIKALAINGILAQTIHTCTAAAFKTRLTLVITSMAARDELSMGNSYFIFEIKSLKRILDKLSTIHCSLYIDEILRGTNTIERIAASAAVLKFIAQHDCQCAVATHDRELCEITSGLFEPYHFSEQCTDDGIRFDFKLKKGVSTTRNAIRLLDFMLYDRGIIDDADNLAAAFERDKKWERL